MTGAEKAAQLAGKQAIEYTPPPSPNHEVNYESEEIEQVANRLLTGDPPIQKYMYEQMDALDKVQRARLNLEDAERRILSDLPEQDRVTNGLNPSPEQMILRKKRPLENTSEQRASYYYQPPEEIKKPRPQKKHKGNPPKLAVQEPTGPASGLPPPHSLTHADLARNTPYVPRQSDYESDVSPAITTKPPVRPPHNARNTDPIRGCVGFLPHAVARTMTDKEKYQFSIEKTQAYDARLLAKKSLMEYENDAQTHLAAAKLKQKQQEENDDLDDSPIANPTPLPYTNHYKELAALKDMGNEPCDQLDSFDIDEEQDPNDPAYILTLSAEELTVPEPTTLAEHRLNERITRATEELVHGPEESAHTDQSQTIIDSLQCTIINLRTQLDKPNPPQTLAGAVKVMSLMQESHKD